MANLGAIAVLLTVFVLIGLMRLPTWQRALHGAGKHRARISRHAVRFRGAA